MKKLYIIRKNNDIVNLGDSMKKRKLKKGPKLILIMIILLIIGIGILSILPKEISKKELTSEEKLVNKMQKISYYRKENKNRYLEYQKKNKSLSLEDIITQVNIGIDNPYYTNTKPSDNLNTNLILVNKYNYVAVNDYVDEAVKKIEAILISEKCRVDRIEEISVESEEEIIHEFLIEKEFDNKTKPIV